MSDHELQHEPQLLELAHACAYCGIHETRLVAQCATCARWFCNHGPRNQPSHLVTHLSMNSHSTVKLHEESDLGDTTLECYTCGNTNVFTLGYVTAKEQNVVIILCRIPCALQKDINWDINSWKALIDERRLVSWVSPPPSEQALQESKRMSPALISSLESSWRETKSPQKVEEVEEEVEPIGSYYAYPHDYVVAFKKLVEREKRADMLLGENKASETISVVWGVSENDLPTVSFTFASQESTGFRYMAGDAVKIRHDQSSTTWEALGYLVEVPNATSEYYVVELERGTEPIGATQNFHVQFVWKDVTYQRMLKALNRFGDSDKMNVHVRNVILGQNLGRPSEAELSESLKDEFSRYNSSQQKAIATALVLTFTLIQGPPGTGKTTTINLIAMQLVRESTRPILVCAPSNVAADDLATHLYSSGIKTVRLVSERRAHLESGADYLWPLNLIAQKTHGPHASDLQDYIRDNLLPAKRKAFLPWLRRQEKELFKNARAICCTCSMAGDPRLKLLQFQAVFVDECTQASEPEALVPLVRRTNKVVLVGDHKQLGPVVLDPAARKAGLEVSLFERLINQGFPSVRLDVQYRMHPALAEFPSNKFYDGCLQSQVTEEKRLVRRTKFPWPIKKIPMMFWNNYGREELSALGVSYINRLEAVNVERIVAKLRKDGIRALDIGVITPYEGQRVYLTQLLRMTRGTLAGVAAPEVEVASVNAFQGREKDYIIFSCVRANDSRSIGFLRDPRRMNVALTRARYGVMILGNAASLAVDPLWNSLLTHYREKGCLVEGPLENLEILMIQLGQPPETQAEVLAWPLNPFNQSFLDKLNLLSMDEV